MRSFSMVLRARAQLVPAWRQMYGEALARTSVSQKVAMRVHATTPYVEVLVDDRGASLPDVRVEALQRVLAAALRMTSVTVRRLSDEPAWRRDATWFRAWAPTPTSEHRREDA